MGVMMINNNDQKIILDVRFSPLPCPSQQYKRRRIALLSSILGIYFISLFSILNCQQIRIDPIDVVGNVIENPDSLRISKDLSPFHRIANSERLRYKPILKIRDINDYQKYWFYLYAKGGTTISDFNPRMDFRIGMQSYTVPELNIYASALGKNEEKNFTTRDYKMDWVPLVWYTNVGLRPALRFNYNAQKGGESNKKTKYYRDLRPLESDLSKFGFSLSAEPKNHPFFQKTQLDLDFLNYQNDNSDQELQPFEISLTNKFRIESFLHGLDFDLHFKHDKPYAESNFYLALPNVNLLAINVQVNKDPAPPSLLISQTFNLNKYVDFSLSNQPFLERKSLFDYQEYFGFADLNEIKDVSQTPINATASLNFYIPIYIRVYAKAQIVKHYNYLYFSHLNVAPGPDYEYLWKKENARKLTFGLDLQKEINGFTLTNNFAYLETELSRSKLAIPWEAHLQNITTLEYHYLKFTTGIKSSLLYQRYSTNLDEDKKQTTLEDTFFLSAFSAYDFTPYLKLFLHIDNVGQEYREIEGLPKEVLNVQLAIRMRF